MHQQSLSTQYSSLYREIYQKRLLGSGVDALSASVLEAAARVASLPDLIDVWVTIGAECDGSAASEELRGSYPEQSRLMNLPLKDMMKSMALEASCRGWAGPPEDFARLIETLYQTAEIREQQLILFALPLLTLQERFLYIATEATRSNIVPVFSALALQNPFPHDHFSENRWNQMVLKAIFVGCDINEITGLHERNNAALCETIFQFVSERHSAHRSISSAVVDLCERALGETSQQRLDAMKPELRLE